MILELILIGILISIVSIIFGVMLGAKKMHKFIFDMFMEVYMDSKERPAHLRFSQIFKILEGGKP